MLLLSFCVAVYCAFSSLRALGTPGLRASALLCFLVLLVSCAGIPVPFLQRLPLRSLPLPLFSSLLYPLLSELPLLPCDRIVSCHRPSSSAMHDPVLRHPTFPCPASPGHAQCHPASRPSLLCATTSQPARPMLSASTGTPARSLRSCRV